MSASPNVAPLPSTTDMQKEKFPSHVESQELARRGRFSDFADKQAREKHHFSEYLADENLPTWLHNSAVVKLSSPVGQVVVNVITQLAGIVAAIAFGNFAVQIANRANAEAHLANRSQFMQSAIQITVQYFFSVGLL